MNEKDEILKKIKGGLIVSCQALSDEPLYSSYIMSRMAYAAQLGGACGIRANTPEDIIKIKELVDTLSIPIIAEGGIWSPEQLKAAINTGVHTAVVGTAITRPMDITKRFIEAITN